MNQNLGRETFKFNETWIKKLLYWASHHYPFISYFNPNGLNYPHGGFNHLFLAGRKEINLTEAAAASGHYRMGIVSYDQKNQYEKLSSNNPSLVDCPDFLFFIAEIRVEFTKESITIHHEDPGAVFSQVDGFPLPKDTHNTEISEIKPLLSKEEYFDNFGKIKEHIREGDIYEMNFCMAYQGSYKRLDPIRLYLSLCKISPMPFSVLFKAQERWVVGSSPERFLKKDMDTLIAQPIKGSIRRGVSRQEDDKLATQLKASEKEQAENLMIVDLMRNDLSRVAQIGEIWVEELFGIYRFKRISQMISTLGCKLRKNVSFEEILRLTFPMGSMTGAPKIKCMELIDNYENFKRGWFSGSLGYITDTGDFDWNVIIRSLILDHRKKVFYFGVGSAITIDADPAYEYEECMLKSHTIFEALKDGVL